MAIVEEDDEVNQAERNIEEIDHMMLVLIECDLEPMCLFAEYIFFYNNTI